LTRVSRADDRSTRLLKKRVLALFRELPKALAGQEEPIHQMRVAGRRLRVALPLLARKPEGKRVRRVDRSLRRLVRTAGSGRDLDVGLALFENWCAEQESLSAELRRLRTRLRAARSRSHHRMAEQLLDLHLARLRQHLRKILARGGDELFAVLGRVRQARDQGGSALLQSMEALGDRFSPQDLHAIRKRVRRIRYVAEVVGELHPETSNEAASTAKALQERLGQIHDACVLSQWFGREQAMLARRNQAALGAEAGTLASLFLELAHQHHRRYLEDSPAASLQKTLELMGRYSTAA
jgi:CHAD domain-containing protein